MPRGRTLSLLALLLVHRGTIVHVDQAVDELWDGAGPKHAKKAVQVLASRLRTALGEGTVLSQGGGYALRLEHGSLDAEAVARIETLPAPCDAEWVIKRHTARALLAAEAGEHERGLEDARAAVAVADTTGLIVCRAHAHRTLAELLWATGRTDAAASAARRALALDEAKANTAAATTTKLRFAPLLGSSRRPVAG